MVLERIELAGLVSSLTDFRKLWDQKSDRTTGYPPHRSAGSREGRRSDALPELLSSAPSLAKLPSEIVQVYARLCRSMACSRQGILDTGSTPDSCLFADLSWKAYQTLASLWRARENRSGVDHLFGDGDAGIPSAQIDEQYLGLLDHAVMFELGRRCLAVPVLRGGVVADVLWNAMRPSLSEELVLFVEAGAPEGTDSSSAVLNFMEKLWVVCNLGTAPTNRKRSKAGGDGEARDSTLELIPSEFGELDFEGPPLKDEWAAHVHFCGQKLAIKALRGRVGQRNNAAVRLEREVFRIAGLALQFQVQDIYRLGDCAIRQEDLNAALAGVMREEKESAAGLGAIRKWVGWPSRKWNSLTTPLLINALNEIISSSNHSRISFEAVGDRTEKRQPYIDGTEIEVFSPPAVDLLGYLRTRRSDQDAESKRIRHRLLLDHLGIGFIQPFLDSAVTTAWQRSPLGVFIAGMRSLHRALHISWHDDKAAPNRQFEQYNMVGGFGRHGAIDSWGFVISRSQNTIHIERQDAKGILPRWQPVCSVGRRMLKEIFGADDAVVFKSGGLDPEVGKQYRLMLQPIRDSQTVSKSEIDELSEMFLQISVSRWGHYKTVFQDRLRRLLHEDFSRAGFSPSLDVGAKITSNIRQIIEQCVRDWQQERQVPEMFPKP